MTRAQRIARARWHARHDEPQSLTPDQVRALLSAGYRVHTEGVRVLLPGRAPRATTLCAAASTLRRTLRPSRRGHYAR